MKKINKCSKKVYCATEPQNILIAELIAVLDFLTWMLQNGFSIYV